jgi:uncharacterized protein (TIGR02594 family)
MTRTVLKSDPPHLKAAFADLGLSEIAGKRHEKRVLSLYADAGHPEVKDDETAWCAAAVGAWLHRAGLPNSGSLMARSYAKYGTACDLKKRVPRGAVAVWPRGKPPSGHVNIVLDDDGTYLTCIGGNQSNCSGGGVTISRELKTRAIACRLPPGIKVSTAPVSKPKPVIADDEQPLNLPEPLPSAAPVPVATVTAEVVQRRLEAMGYFPGKIGDVPGGMTAGAVAAFKMDRGVGNDGAIDDAMLAELDKAEAQGFKRPIAESRANATEATIAPKVEAIRQNWFSRLWAKLLALPGLIFAALSGAWDELPEAKSYIEPAKDFITDMPGWAWGLLIGGVGLYLWHSTRKTGAAVLKDFQEGRRL